MQPNKTTSDILQCALYSSHETKLEDFIIFFHARIRRVIIEDTNHLLLSYLFSSVHNSSVCVCFLLVFITSVAEIIYVCIAFTQLYWLAINTVLHSIRFLFFVWCFLKLIEIVYFFICFWKINVLFVQCAFIRHQVIRIKAINWVMH